MLPFVALGLLLLVLAGGKSPSPAMAPLPPSPAPPPKAPTPSGFHMVVMNPGETWSILARALKPMTDDAWSSFASNIGDSMRAVGATVQNFRIGSGNDFAFSIVPNIVIKLPVPSSSADFRIEKAERLSAAPSV